MSRKKECCFSICNVMEPISTKDLKWKQFIDWYSTTTMEQKKKIVYSQNRKSTRLKKRRCWPNIFIVCKFPFSFFFFSQLLYFAFVSRFLWLDEKVWNATNSLSHRQQQQERRQRRRQRQRSQPEILVGDLAHRSNFYSCFVPTSIHNPIIMFLVHIDKGEASHWTTSWLIDVLLSFGSKILLVTQT